jgi:hypothetical protein
MDKGYFAYCDTDSIFIKPDYGKGYSGILKTTLSIFT